MASDNAPLGFGAESTYGWEEGLLQIPVCGRQNDGSQPSEFIRLHSPCGSKAVNFDVTSVGTPTAMLPDPIDQDPNCVFLRMEITSVVPVESGSADGQMAWRVRGRYIYGLKRPYWVNTPLPVGKVPGSAFPVQALPPQAFAKSLSSPGSTPVAISK